MSDLSPRLMLPFLQAAQAQKHVTHNESLDLLDMLVQLTVEQMGAETPPEEPQDGAVWALGALPLLAWAGQAGRLASWRNGAWVFVDPQEGWQVWDKAEARPHVRSGGAWVPLGQRLDLQGVDRVGVAATADAANPLTVAGPGALFTHAGTDHRLTVNKAGPAQTASVLFQSGWSGRAEIGLTGSDDFALRVSAAGSSFVTALGADRTTGVVSLPAGAVVGGSLSGPAVTQSALDATAGRLMRVGDFGLGTPAGAAQPMVSLNAAVIPGFYSYSGSDPAAPAPGNSGPLTVERHATQFIRQEAGAATLGGRWQRRSTDGGTTWTAWRRVLNAETLLGTVSQSGGVPTGAVMERGSNANGDFLRLACGTQICWSAGLSVPAVATAVGALFESDPLTWVYPAAFSHLPPVVLAGGGDTRRWGTASPGAGQSATVRLMSPTSNTASQPVRALAIGRWF